MFSKLTGKYTNSLAGCLTVILFLAGAPVAFGHVGDALLPEGCGSCHVGHGMAGQPMLAQAEEDFCYQCHGSEEKRTRMISSGRLSAAAVLADVEREFRKPFRHPVQEGTGHLPTEQLPSFKGATIGHAECVDCHNPHQRIEAGKPMTYKVAGYSLSGQNLETSLHEYEICLKCHTDYLGVDRTERSLSAEFALGGRSQHPVTREASGAGIPSMPLARTPGMTMTCSDCHTSDDPNGPRGPHGSDYRFLLSGNYTLDVYAEESPQAYEFCYSCHDRYSILGNESFPLHREHIVGDPLSGRPGTSCFTCHNSHGSRDNPYLLEFNPKAVTRETNTGFLQYQKTAAGSGKCYLRCHDHNHSPAEY